jgi:5-oxoprolinase (ATP-hydrolysing)
MTQQNTRQSTNSEGKWQFWIDRGGTFTDIVARHPDGSLTTHKLLSENPERYKDAAIQGIRDLLNTEECEQITSNLIENVKMGTTVATNALLERKGDRTLLAITEGFRDQLRIGYQNRPKIFARKIELPELLYEDVIEIPERISAHGEEIRPVDVEATRKLLEESYNAGFRSVSIVFMHGYRYQHHEKQVARIAEEIGFTQISASHQVSPLMKLVGRGDTTVVDAYVSPILKRYVDQVSDKLGGSRLMFMQSNGGLIDARFFQGKDSILSGPAGGIVGAVKTAEMAGFPNIIGFDMGGTSTDVTHYNGQYERTFETQVAGVRMRAPMMQIHTVAAGGGSVLHFDGSRFRVGPESAGANPGPACYRRNGPLAVTDANVMLGKIQPEFFPKVFGPQGDEEMDANVVREKFFALADEIQKATGNRLSPNDIAEGFVKIAVENMANAIKQISVQRGYDVTSYTLNCFGGAGGQHACMVADALGIKRVFVHPFAGVLSAYGMGLADQRLMRECAVEETLNTELLPKLRENLNRLELDSRQEMTQQGTDGSLLSVVSTIHLRYEGTDTALIVNFSDLDQMRADFEEIHRQQFGFISADKDLIVEALSLEVIAPGDSIDFQTYSSKASQEPDPETTVAMFTGGQPYQTPIYLRKNLTPGVRVDGPAILIESNATTIVEPGWRAEITDLDHLVMNRVRALPSRVAIGTQADPVMLEVFNNLFMSIAEQMGGVLQNTSYSVNIKERLDFSCAIFDTHGDLVANAPHIPVHLGSMSESVKTVLRERKGNIKPGDVFMLNTPYNGGTHLPDVTVITPVFEKNSSELLFTVASRGHHAEIGGITPGSMPPNSTHIEEEGILLDNIQLVSSGNLLEREAEAIFSEGRFPTRNFRHNLGDLKAQIAANEKGVQELLKMIDHFGLDVVKAYMQHVQDNAEESVRRVIDTLRDGEFTYETDFGAQIHVSIQVNKMERSATIDFTGTSEQQPNNFNAPSAICVAATLYVFRTLVDDDIPLNAGCLKPLRIVIPDGCMLKPDYPAAVVAGNVETSQAITDTLFGALGIMAAAQGTMNNFTFGNDNHQYYETICGGSGAGPDYDGVDAVHTHMTNTRLTDPEILEFRFPVLLEEFSIRHGSGGAGKYRGGSGVVRRIKFLEDMTASILSGHRKIPPYGLEGGKSGKPGRNYIVRRNGNYEEMGGNDSKQLLAGETIIIETPGGGGYGRT